MAKTSQPNSATSEFFINVDRQQITYQTTAASTKPTLCLATVIAGKDVVDAIANAPVTQTQYKPHEKSVPVNPVTILHATIVP